MRSGSLPMPLAATKPNSARWLRRALTSMVRFSIDRSRERCSVESPCCSIVLTGAKRIEGRPAASLIASASMASFFPRLT